MSIFLKMKNFEFVGTSIKSTAGNFVVCVSDIKPNLVYSPILKQYKEDPSCYKCIRRGIYKLTFFPGIESSAREYRINAIMPNAKDIMESWAEHINDVMDIENEYIIQRYREAIFETCTIPFERNLKLDSHNNEYVRYNLDGSITALVFFVKTGAELYLTIFGSSIYHYDDHINYDNPEIELEIKTEFSNNKAINNAL